MDDTEHPSKCPRCGAGLATAGPEGLCPACLFAAALDSQSTVDVNAESRHAAVPATSGPQPEPVSLAPGQTFGPYRIERLLGSGGMGAVYEAEQIEEGRRVALKVLHRRLADVGDRARFLREGQLAASLNHPHTVYIFGSEEILGTPAIAMELLPGGTLKDRLAARGPLPPAEAVDAILQVIAGLDAMQLAGVLHRDVKPANCFVDASGVVKIGDFGLSISTIARGDGSLTAAGTFHGTPQFAAPEQLKGEPLDVRADIYAVGATLYYLLTGEAPFDDANLLALAARIATEAPPALRARAPRVPRALEAIVLRCLAKDKALRPASYAVLHDALQPFSAGAPAPATLGARLVAGALDEAVVRLSVTVFVVAILVRGAPPAPRWWSSVLPLVMIWVAYYGIAEGRWGAGVGKRLLGLEVVRAGSRQRPGIVRATWRAVLFKFPLVAQSAVNLLFDQAKVLELSTRSPLMGVVPWLITGMLIALIFVTARRRNGFAGAHDLLSGTRVVRRQERGRSPAPDAVLPLVTAPLPQPPLRRIGPFDVVGALGTTEAGTMLAGFDPRLRRQVWLHDVPAGTPRVAPAVRDLGRPGRLRWLGGRRAPTENWDAYEAPDGAAFVALLDRPHSWASVRLWLSDLAQEIDAGLRDGSLGQLSPDRIWITSRGRAKLLDFGAPGASAVAAGASGASAISPRALLGEVGMRALTGHAVPASSRLPPRVRRSLPVSASAMLQTMLEQGRSESWPDVARRVTASAHGPVRVERWRRVVTLALSGAIPVAFVLMMAVLMGLLVPTISRLIPPEIQDLGDALNEAASLRFGVRNSTDRSALDTYIAGRFRQTMADDPQFWKDPLRAGYLGRHRLLLEQILADNPQVSPEQLAAATARLGPYFARRERIRIEAGTYLWWLPISMAPLMFGVSAIVGLVSAVLFRGGLLLRVFDIAVVGRDGALASRRRTLWRAVVAWTPAIVPMCTVLPLALWPVSQRAATVIAIGSAIIFLAGAAWAVVHPGRGLQDRIARTFLVPQ